MEPTKEQLNALGVAISHLWANERVLEQAKIQANRALAKLTEAYDEIERKTVIVVIEKQAFLVQDANGQVDTTLLPWVVTDLSVAPRHN